MNPPDLDAAAKTLAAIAVEAGRLLAGVRERGAGQVTKPDGTPSTDADLAAERLIVAGLAGAFPDVPVVAEETAQAVRAELFFLVDPLDGTRDYLTGTGEYSVNVALIRGTRPIAAALASPPLGRVWAAGATAYQASIDAQGGIGRWEQVAPRRAPSGGLVALTSRRHGDDETERWLQAFPGAARRTVSSAVKFGLIASGEADLYLRYGPTSEWDTAAGDHILSRAGGMVVGPDQRPLTYGHAERGYLNGPFAALGDPALVARLTMPVEAAAHVLPATP